MHRKNLCWLLRTVVGLGCAMVTIESGCYTPSFYKHNINKIEHFIRNMAIAEISPDGNVIRGF